jgi:predicted permease
VVIQGIYRSNFVLFGLQVSASLCPQNELGTVAILIAVIIPMYNLFAVLLFEIFREGKVQIGRVLVNISKNPLIIGSLLGIAALFSGIRFGTMVDGTLADIAKLATPMSLVLLGATITLGGMVRQWKILTVVTFCRLVLVPGIFLGGAILLGFRHTALVALMVMFAAPTAVSSFPMAITMGGDGELAGQIVASTTIFSVVSIFVWTYFLHYFAWI